MHLEVKNVSKSFSATKVLKNVSFQVESGKALGLLGRNGAGKTTTIRILMNLFHADEGEILLDGERFCAKDHQIGYLPEERGLYPKKKVTEQLVYLGQLRGLSKREAKQKALKWLEKLGVSEYKDRKLETLSKGNQQKVQLAQTFFCEPQIIILDEPFSGLDPVNSQILKEIIRELIREDKLLIFSSHQMSYVEEFCEDITMIHYGEIVMEGNLRAIKREMGENRLVLRASKQSHEQLTPLLQRHFANRIEIQSSKENEAIVRLQRDETKEDFLKEVMDLNIEIEKFSIYEPTLEDIFIQKVGD
ncbi:MAG TPA: ABC transporter ATP-binding protein [Eubacteriaceae bacterium]|nr:ABC transporter ATP-binding protein [Eubacteriaceae bacterium]